ncbi:MAG: DUF512 domain-containing protein [Coriobacteriales bacterium]|jgi:NifB/MoaA-like Fe-S oxidoreductase|nr:DUF512 domain-containing protein [Coriobacteriales bacterium]
MARIARVTEGSVADKAGLCAGMNIVAVDGQPVGDILDWLWLSAGDDVELSLTDSHSCHLMRKPGQAWGISLDGLLFDGMRRCVNDCVFCFVKMLPSGMRPALYAYDDDYRLSFFEGNFITLTNLSDTDIQRIVRLRLSPLNVSLHAVSPDYRQWLMGKNHVRGLVALEALLDGGIQVQAQIVLMPDAAALTQLARTLDYIEQRPGIVGVGIVPFGYTRFCASLPRRGRTSSCALAAPDPESACSHTAPGPESGCSSVTSGIELVFQSEYAPSKTAPPASLAEHARQVIGLLQPYQQRSRVKTGKTRFYLADEFYLRAWGEKVTERLPRAEHYDDYPQYENGIGMLRNWLDEAAALPVRHRPAPAMQRHEPSRGRSTTVDCLVITGAAFAPTLKKSLNKIANSYRLTPFVLAVKNNFFGGAVDVAGLLTAHDVIDQVAAYLKERPGSSPPLVLPRVMFNDEGLTLDDKTAADIAQALECRVVVVDCSPAALADALETLSGLVAAR